MGWAQLLHGYAAGADETKVELEYDLYYVKYLSPALDALIAIHAARAVFTRFGAR